jgi:predicted secreted protein
MTHAPKFHVQKPHAAARAKATDKPDLQPPVWVRMALATAPVLAFGLFASAAWAQPQMALYPPPQNLVTLEAEASTEVTQDRLIIVLAATRDGTDAALVQSQLRQVLDTALTEARKSVRPGQLEVRSGSFSVYPRYSAKPGGGNQITGWQGRGELVLEGRDTAAVSQLAGRLAGLTVQQVSFGLSREAREKAEAEVAAQAIAAFKLRAERYAQAFGFASYSLREVSVGGSSVGGGGPVPTMRVAARAMSAGVADESQPVEAGKATVSVTVSGSIQLSPR